jgi:hypothetical protein
VKDQKERKQYKSMKKEGKLEVMTPEAQGREDRYFEVCGQQWSAQLICLTAAP